MLFHVTRRSIEDTIRDLLRYVDKRREVTGLGLAGDSIEGSWFASCPPLAFVQCCSALFSL